MALEPAQIFVKDESCDYVAVMSRCLANHGTFFFQTPRNTVQCFIGQFIGCEAVPAIKISNEPSPHFEISLAAGICALVEPGKKLMPRVWRQRPVSFLLSPLNVTVFHGAS